METRLSSRLHIELKVISHQFDESYEQQFNLAPGTPFEAHVFDISERGAGVLSKYFLPKGLKLGLSIEGKPFELNRNINIKAEVRYCHFIKDCVNKCGIKFLDISEEDKKLIAKFITTR